MRWKTTIAIDSLMLPEQLFPYDRMNTSLVNKKIINWKRPLSHPKQDCCSESITQRALGRAGQAREEPGPQQENPCCVFVCLLHQACLLPPLIISHKREIINISQHALIRQLPAITVPVLSPGYVSIHPHMEPLPCVMILNSPSSGAGVVTWALVPCRTCWLLAQPIPRSDNAVEIMHFNSTRMCSFTLFALVLIWTLVFQKWFCSGDQGRESNLLLNE